MLIILSELEKNLLIGLYKDGYRYVARDIYSTDKTTQVSTLAAFVTRPELESAIGIFVASTTTELSPKPIMFDDHFNFILPGEIYTIDREILGIKEGLRSKYKFTKIPNAVSRSSVFSTVFLDTDDYKIIFTHDHAEAIIEVAGYQINSCPYPMELKIIIGNKEEFNQLIKSQKAILETLETYFTDFVYTNDHNLDFQ